MSKEALSWVNQVPGLAPGRRTVLTELAKLHRDSRCIVVSQVRLAQAACVSRSQLNEHLKALEKMGLLIRERDRATDRRITGYRLAISELGERLVNSASMPVLVTDATEKRPKIGQNSVRKSDANNIRNRKDARTREHNTSNQQDPEGVGAVQKDQQNADRLELFASAIAGSRYVAPSALSPSDILEILQRGLVDPEKLRKSGFPVPRFVQTLSKRS